MRSLRSRTLALVAALILVGGVGASLAAGTPEGNRMV